MSSRSSRRFAIVGTAAAATAVAASLAVTQLPANAAPDPATPVVAAPAATVDVKAETLAKYGVYPLPVRVTEIEKFKLNKKLIKDIASAKALAGSREARKIRACESGGNYRTNTGNGYFGAYQFDRSTWLGNGGGRYGRTANLAPSWAQDYIMWKTHKARGWSPWACA